MKQNQPISNPIPKDLPTDKTLFWTDYCKYNRLISGISYIIFLDPYKLSNEKDVELRSKASSAIESILKKLDRQKVLIIVPKTLKLRSLQHRFIQSNDFIWIELKTEDHFFHFESLQKKISVSKRKLNQGIRLEKINQKCLNHKFLAKQDNCLAQYLPDLLGLGNFLKVINVKAVFPDERLCLSLNASLNQAICYLSNQSIISLGVEYPPDQLMSELLCSADPNWRKLMAFQIVRQLDFEKYSVTAIYLIGSAKNNSAGMGSDIDLMIHFRGTESQKEKLNLWLEGWSRCLSVMNYLKTGYQTDGILDVHYISDASIAKKDSFTIKIDAVTDSALLLKSNIN